MERLRASGLGVFVLTNGTDRVPEELDELGLGDFLGTRRRFLLNTADLGAAKPDREAFVRAHARIKAELGERWTHSGSPFSTTPHGTCAEPPSSVGTPCSTPPAEASPVALSR